MKGSDFVARYLEARGVTHTFELVGGMIAHLLHSLSQITDIKIVSCHHEQAAGFAAEGFARISGIPGVALATSGPGATNLLTAIGSCYYDSTPAVFITGQVNTYELKCNTGVRQLGFQETDIAAMAKPICKLAVQAQKATDLPSLLKAAYDLSLEGRQGPCLVDIPMNVQAEDIAEDEAESCLQEARQNKIVALTRCSDHQRIANWVEDLCAAIATSERPLLLLGGGAASAPNRGAARQISRSLGIPVVVSLMAVDVLSGSDPQRVGFIGSYGNRWANTILAEADLLVVIGSRLDIRQTGSHIESFCKGKQIWQLDIDQHEIGLRIKVDRSVVGSIVALAKELRAHLDSRREPLGYPSAWDQRIQNLATQFPAESEYTAAEDEINPILLLQSLDSLAKSKPTNYVTDVGQHQMWCAQSLKLRQDDRFLTSGGMGAMGFGLPAAIGAALARPDAATILISGDGSFQLNIQELETIKRNNLDVKIVLFNNSCHGMVRQFQESYFDGHLQSTALGYSAPDFARVATAYGIQSAVLKHASKSNSAIGRMQEQPGPYLLEVVLPQFSKVYPKLAYGRDFGEMEPEASPLSIESG